MHIPYPSSTARALATCALTVAISATFISLAHAGDPALSIDTSAQAATDNSTRYGLFGLLDHRSSYGEGYYPEPFLIDDSDLEVNEFRLDWFHAKAGPARTDLGTLEVEKGFGQLTLEIEVPYERDASPGSVTKGFANTDLGARLPFYQYVAPSGFFDTTFGVAVEVGIPNTSPVSKNTEVVPKIFNDLRIGEHFTLQSITGLSTLFGPGDDGGLQVLEYGFLAGITIYHKELPIRGVDQIIPLFELSGEKQLNHDGRGLNTMIGNAAVRVNLKAIGKVQPRLGVGWVFPVNEAARSDVHAGIYTSFVFE